ncbi:MAG: hypothetical protein ACTMHL_01455 [Janibacter sp.]
MTQTHRTRSIVATAAAAALALTACGGGDDSSPSSQSGGKGQDKSSSSTEAKSTGETVTATKSKVSFEAPKGWEAVDVTDKKAAKNPPSWLKSAAKQQKVKPQKILQAWAQSGMEVVVAGDSKLSKSISVANLPKMPSEKQLKSQLKQGGAKVKDPEKVKTSVGTGYSVTSADKKTQGQSLLVLPADKGAAVIQVVAADAKSANKISTGITDSVKKA